MSGVASLADLTTADTRRRMPRTTVAQRLAIIHRYLDGAPGGIAALATEIGVNAQTVSGWIDDWERRIGPWWERPLEPWEIERGFVIIVVACVGGYEKRVARPLDDEGANFAGPRRTRDDALAQLMTILARIPTQDRTALVGAYQALDEQQRAALGPVYDLYLQASEQMDKVRQTTKEALAVATRELAQLGAKRKEVA